MAKSARYFAVLALSLLSTAAFAHDYRIGSLKIGHPWSRATPAGAKVAGGFLTVENTGTTPDRLIAITAPFAGRGEIHEMAMTNGVMTMRPLEKGIEIPPGGKLELKPGSFHIMFQELKQPLLQDERMKATLTFEQAGTVEVDFKVEGVGAKTAPSEHKTH